MYMCIYIITKPQYLAHACGTPLVLQIRFCQCTGRVKLTVVLIMMKHQGFAAEPS